MFSITEQFSAATKSQLEAQLKIINTFASKAVESAEKVIALNISTTKASVEKTSSAAKQLFEVKDPRELFSLGSNQTPYLDNVLAYSRQLFNIATAAQADLMQSAKEQIKEAPALTLVAPAPAKKTASQPEVLAKAANEAIVLPKAEVKVEAKVEAAPAVKMEAKPEAPPETKPEPKVEAKAKPVVELEAGDQPVVAVEAAPLVVEAKPAAAPSQPAAKVSVAAKPAGEKQLDMLGKGKK